MGTRRWFLAAGGALAAVGAVGGGLAGYAWFPGEAKAREPWLQAGESFGDARLDALAWAILAPNPHNRQPWTFELAGSDAINVRCDLARRLPHTDPFDRQIVIGFGCMLELLSMAAAEKGHFAEIELFPDGEPKARLAGERIARVAFRQGQAPRDPLFGAVPKRRSNKEPFTDKAVEPGGLEAILAAAGAGVAAGGTLESGRVARLADLSWRAWMVEYETARTRRESIDLMRIGNRAVAENPDGIDMGGLPMGLMGMFGMVTPASLDAPGTVAFKSGVDIYRPIITSAKGHVWLTTADGSRASQIAAGRSWVRMNLEAQRVGLAFHPISQALQEYPEMSGHYAEIRSELGVTAPGMVQMLGRIGHGIEVDAAPRWPLTAKLVKDRA